MITKTAKIINCLKSGEYIEAVRIAKDFRIGFTKDEQSIITRAHEMQWSDFYNQLGYDKETELAKAVEILLKKYEKFLSPT